MQDVQDAGEMYQFYLTGCGYDVVVAEDGDQGMQVAPERRPRVILNGMGLPVIDRWSLIRLRRGDARTRSIRVVALSGHDARDCTRVRGRMQQFPFEAMPPRRPGQRGRAC